MDIIDPISMIVMQGTGSAAQGEISFLSWNSKVQHILASSSYNGTTGELYYTVQVFVGYSLHFCFRK